jgi:hypothetical protein
MSSGLDAVRDALAEVKDDGGFQPRRVALAPVAPLPPTATGDGASPAFGESAAVTPPSAVEPIAPASPGPDDDETIGAAREAARLPGTAKGHRRLLAVNLPAATRRRLDAARGEPPVRTRSEIVLDALAAAFDTIAEERAAQLAAPQTRFATSSVRRRRLALDDPRDVPIQFAPEEAATVKEAADEVGLTVSALITDALDRHLGE